MIIEDHHTYRLLDGKHLLASANCLADVRRIANYIFGRDPERQGIDVLAWGYNPKTKTAGYSAILSIMRSELPLLKAA